MCVPDLDVDAALKKASLEPQNIKIGCSLLRLDDSNFIDVKSKSSIKDSGTNRFIPVPNREIQKQSDNYGIHRAYMRVHIHSSMFNMYTHTHITMKPETDWDYNKPVSNERI